MPLDALSGQGRAESFAISFAQRDIRPVDCNALAAHKQAQLEKFGPSFWYQHQALLGFTLIGCIGCMALTAGAANSLAQPSSPVSLWIAVAWMCLIAALMVSGVLRVHAGSHWEERWVPIDRLETFGVPERIAVLARLMQRELPGSTVILGELVRESVVLDPYLLLVSGEERICVGLWDETGIIATASWIE